MTFWLGLAVGVFLALTAWLIKEVVVLRRQERGRVSKVPHSDDRVVWHASPSAPARPAGPRRVRVRRAVFSREKYIDGGG